MASRKLSVLTVALLLGASGAARADVSISNKPTSNMSCAGGVCTATAQKAVLNVSDLANMLASGDVAVKTGTVAKDINIDQPLTWTSTSKLTLDAQQSVEIGKQVTVAGQGALTVTTNDTGGAKSKSKAGEFIVVPERGSVQLWDPSSSLVIDGQSYTLVYDIKTLAADIAANPSGFYALAKPYDASADGTYQHAPISTLKFYGAFNGLGNTVAHVTVKFTAGSTQYDNSAFFSEIGSGGSIRNVGIISAALIGSGNGTIVGLGLLASDNFGIVDRCWTQGIIQSPGSSSFPGGLVGANEGVISNSSVNANISLQGGTLTNIGGLVGFNTGTISNSAATGSVSVEKAFSTNLGGFAGYNQGTLLNAFSRAAVHNRRPVEDGWAVGGFLGKNDGGSSEVQRAYAAGHVSGYLRRKDGNIGGFVGLHGSGTLSHVYWDMDKGVGDPGRGAGNIRNDQGVTGLTTQQLQSGLPNGFDPNVWGQKPPRNGGFPYLLGVPSK